MQKQNLKVVNIYICLDCAYKYQDFATNKKKENFAQLHDCETVTFRYSACLTSVSAAIH